ncbi:hypothetical protein POJ06DRAFT_15001 [Lipomyces tetrasporus]|uniref:Uncharacterized protein n=1 Tax=Lipomyces tetrasporus TaxID=54092 RepID=A0AAD7VVF2_9ASCO|nr:uncharacterized protein POJ06DRAFT_15001 [Lipomyces tetrasporus]KAJ8104197.1 hypothetical protein POJ06DRAFT_15001 [Lipomyces tetrasporus]
MAAPTSFSNRTAIVTGAAGSIGKPLCFALARAGANVVANDYGCSSAGGGSSAIVEDLAKELRAAGLSAIADTHDISTDAEKIVDLAIKTFGRIDILINNAGIIIYGSIEDQSISAFRKVFEVNALGAMALIHYAWPHMKRQKYGRVVNFSSDSVFGMPYSSTYVLARGAMLGVTKSLAIEGKADNILVNSVGPCAFSRMVADVIGDLPPDHQEAFKATYSGESNAPAILALASEKNKYTGQTWVSGGWAMGRTAIMSIQEIKGLKTVDEVLKGMEVLMDKERESIEPQSIEDYLSFRSQA